MNIANRDEEALEEERVFGGRKDSLCPNNILGTIDFLYPRTSYVLTSCMSVNVMLGRGHGY